MAHYVRHPHMRALCGHIYRDPASSMTVEFFGLFLLVVTLVGTLILFLPEPSAKARWLLAVLVASAMAHFLLEGARWQMVPCYSAAALFTFAILLEKRWIRACLASIALLLTITSGLASWAFPIFELPRPDGPYSVGTTKVMFIDKDRKESYTDDPTDVRRLMLRVWYPASPGTESRAAYYWEDAITRSRATTNGIPLPWFTFSHLGRVKTFSRWDAGVADGTFPIVLYSHGLGIGWSSANTPLVEQLASHGYIVVGVDHAFIGSASIFPDQVITFDEATRTALNTEPPREVREVYDKVAAETDPSEQLRLYMHAMSLMPVSIKRYVDIALRVQVEDQKAVLQNLEVLDDSNVHLSSHLDQSRIGLIGMSLGGSAAIITCTSSLLCKSVINLDGFHPDQANVQLTVPSMSLHRPDNLLVHVNFAKSLANSYLLRIDGTTHFNFFDFSIMSPLYKRLGVLGPINGNTMVEIVSLYSLAFFDATLKGVAPEILQSTEQSDFPEVHLQRRGPHVTNKSTREPAI